MSHVRVAPPTTPLVSLRELREHCLPLSDDDDAYLIRLAEAARGLLEVKTARTLVPTTWRQTFERFPCGPREPLELDAPPLVGVTQIGYVDRAGAAQTLVAADLIVDAASEPGRVKPVASWPPADPTTPIAVTYTAGYAAGAAPEEAKQAALLLVGHWYRNREAVAPTALAALPMAVDALVAALRWGGYR